MEEILEYYYENEAKKLHRVVNKIFQKKYGGIIGRDMDEFYSVANDVLADIWKYDRYNPARGDFGGFLYVALDLAIIDEFKRQTRDKRCTKITVEEDIDGTIVKRRMPVSDIYLDKPIGEDNIGSVSDFFYSDFDIEKESGFFSDEKVEQYLLSLSVKQKEIAEMIMDGYSPSEIKTDLHLSEHQYKNALKDMRTFEKSKILKYQDYVQTGEDEPMQELYMQTTQTFEKSKPDKLSISAIIRKIDNCTIRFDHPLQRASEQWSPAMKGNLISDILQGNPIPALVFAEQIVNNLAIIWNLDGKQRCTNVHSFHNDGYKITKNVRRWNIKYQATICDKEKKPILDEKGFPQSEKREFDIRGKKFSDLPEELRDKLMDYNFEIVQYLNCSSEDIAYHIARYNEGKPMTASQKGITRLGEEFASIVKSISGMTFFKELGGYKVSEGNNGTVNRVVVESVMAANFLTDWKKKQEDMCEYMKDNATVEQFDSFEDVVERISNVGNDEVFNMFDSKDSFIWFGLFTRFCDTGLEDEKFIEFMAEFNQSLHSKIINEVSYNELDEKSTKDKKVVLTKMNHLEHLMKEYFGISTISESEKISSTLEFVRKNVNPEVTYRDIKCYEEDLDMFTLDVDNSSKLLDVQNHTSLVALVAYSYIEDIELDEWILHYFKYNNTYNMNQKENFLHMKEILEEYISANKKTA